MPEGQSRKFLLLALVTALTLIVTVYDSLPAYAKPRTYEIGDLVVVRGVPIKDGVPAGDAQVSGEGAGHGPGMTAVSGVQGLRLVWLSGAPVGLVQADRVRLQLDGRVPADSRAPQFVLELPAGCVYVGTVGRLVDGRPVDGTAGLGRVGDGGTVRWDLSGLVEPGSDSSVSVACELMVTAEQLDELVLGGARLEREDAVPVQAVIVNGS